MLRRAAALARRAGPAIRQADDVSSLLAQPRWLAAHMHASGRSLDAEGKGPAKEIDIAIDTSGLGKAAPGVQHFVLLFTCACATHLHI